MRLAFTPARPVRSMRWTGPIRRRTGRERRARCAPRNARGQGSQTTLSCGKNIMRKTTFRETVIYELVAAYLLVGRKCNLTIYRILMQLPVRFLCKFRKVFSSTPKPTSHDHRHRRERPDSNARRDGCRRGRIHRRRRGPARRPAPRPAAVSPQTRRRLRAGPRGDVRDRVWTAGGDGRRGRVREGLRGRARCHRPRARGVVHALVGASPAEDPRDPHSSYAVVVSIPRCPLSTTAEPFRD